MVNILLLSHSLKLVQGLKEILGQMACHVNIEISGGTFDGGIGSNFEEIMQKMNDLSDKGELVVIFDIGSSMLNALTAYEMIDDEKKDKIVIADVPMVESAVQVAVMAEAGQSFNEIKQFLEENKMNKIE